MNQMTGESAVPAARDPPRVDRAGRADARGARLRDGPDRAEPRRPSDQRRAPTVKCPAALDHRHLRLPRRRSAHHDGHARRPDRPAQAPARRRCRLRMASLLAAFSTSSEMLIASRAVMGIAGATIAPSTLSLIFTMFLDSRQRSTAIGVWIAAYSAGGAIGPVLGGILLEFFWWGSVFLIGVPVMALLLILGPRTLPEYRDPNARPLDLLSAALSLLAILGVVYGLKQIAQDGVSVDAGPDDRRRTAARVRVRAPAAWARVADHRRATLPDPRVQCVARRLFPRHLRRRRLLPLHCAVPAARPWAVTARSGAVVPSFGGGVHRRLDHRPADHPSLPPIGDHGSRHGHRRCRHRDAPRALRRGRWEPVAHRRRVGRDLARVGAGDHASHRAHRGQRAARAGRRRNRGRRRRAASWAVRSELRSSAASVSRCTARSSPSCSRPRSRGRRPTRRATRSAERLAVAQTLPGDLGAALAAAAQTAFVDALHFVAAIAAILAAATAIIVSAALWNVPARSVPASEEGPGPAAVAATE